MDLAFQPHSVKILDGDPTSCYGFSDRSLQNDFSPVTLRLYLYHVSQPTLQLKFSGAENCAEFREDVILSSRKNPGTEGCDKKKQCSLVGEDLVNNQCTILCHCPFYPCEVQVLILPMSNSKICEIN